MISRAKKPIYARLIDSEDVGKLLEQIHPVQSVACESSHQEIKS